MVRNDDRQRPRDLDELEGTLRALGRRIEFPPTPHLWPAVERRLLAAPVPVPVRRRPWAVNRAGSWRLAAAAIVLLLVATAVVVAPELSRAVADRLGLTGVVIRFVGEPPLAPTAPAGAALGLGQRVDMDDAIDRAGFPLRAPTMPGFETPDEVYVTFDPSNPMVSFVYSPRDHLPASRYSGAGALLTQFEGSVERGMIAKGLMDDSAIASIRVNESPGFWIDGAAHTFMYLDPSGHVQTEPYRLAGNVLLWEADGITYRFESELSREAAIAIAESMQPVSPAGTN